jgi:hypothetical protein
MEQLVSQTKSIPRARPLDEIVDDIVCILGDVEGKALVLPGDETRAKVRRAIEDSTQFFHNWNKWCSREGRATIAKDAGELAELIAALESRLKHLPDPLADYLFGPQIARHALMPVDDIMATTLADKRTLLDRLGLMRCDCQRQRPPPESSGPEQDRAKHHCAALARNLMKAFSKLQITGTAEGPYRVIAGLLYEGLTEKAEVDLKRACDRALHSTVT